MEVVCQEEGGQWIQERCNGWIESEMGSPSGQDNGLRSNARLPGNASNMREVSAPLATVQSVLPPLPHPYALHHIVSVVRGYQVLAERMVKCCGRVWCTRAPCLRPPHAASTMLPLPRLRSFHTLHHICQSSPCDAICMPAQFMVQWAQTGFTLELMRLQDAHGIAPDTVLCHRSPGRSLQDALQFQAASLAADDIELPKSGLLQSFNRK